MKNTKAIFLILLGTFLIATGFAYAGDSALDQLKAISTDTSAVQREKAAAPGEPLKMTEKIAPPAPVAVPAPIPVPPAPEKKPTAGEQIKEFLGDHKADLLIGGVGAYLGFALIGTVAGALTGGLGLLLFVMIANL